MSFVVRNCRLPDDAAAMTRLLHRAYAELAAQGLRYVATHQSVKVTERRASAGCCFVAELDQQMVGTITVRRWNAEAQVAVYREPGTFIFGQFGVDPDHRGKGIGRSLHQHVMQFARESGGTAMALDTALPAQRLIEMYRRWGYSEVARHQWDVTNYESVIMRRTIQTVAVPILE